MKKAMLSTGVRMLLGQKVSCCLSHLNPTKSPTTEGKKGTQPTKLERKGLKNVGMLQVGGW